MYKMTEKLENLAPYDPIQGTYKIRLDANESFVATSRESLTKAIGEISLNRYPDPYAGSLIEAYSSFYGADPDLVTAGNGSDELISIITACFLQKQDKIMCFAPDFSMYSFYSSLYELNTVVAQKESDLTIDIDKAIQKINSEDFKAVIFSNPCNPTSLGIEKKDVIRLITSVNALVVLDEAYMDFWDEAQSLLLQTEDYDNLIVLRTCSKALGMAGLRLGFAISNRRLTEKLRTAKSPYNVNSLTQCVAEYYLRDTQEMKTRIQLCKAAKKELYEGIAGLNLPFFEKIYPSVTNFVFVKAPQAKEIYGFLLSNSIAVRYMGDYLRITSGTHEENEELFKTLSSFK